jgi:hypothetical protein
MQAARHVEGVINKKIGLDTSKKEMTVENVMNTAGTIKVVPIFGEKGNLSAVEHKSEEPEDLLSSIEDIRRAITTSVGIPYEVLFASDDESKGNMLRRYARYLRLLKNIQRSITNGIKEIIFIHLANKGIQFKSDSIEVNFRHKLIEIDNLDALEFLDTSIGMISNTKDFIFDLADVDSPLHKAIKFDEFVKFISEQFRMVGLQGVVDTNVDISKEPPPDADDDKPNWDEE